MPVAYCDNSGRFLRGISMDKEVVTKATGRARDKGQMAAKSSCKGKMSARRAIACLSMQKILQSEPNDVIERIYKRGHVRLFKKGRVITSQGELGEFVYFVLSGTIDVKVNDRVIAARRAKDCVGEMSALDPTQNRSATLVAAEDSTLLEYPASEMVKLIESSPMLAKRMAIELSERLRERAKLIRVPNPKPVVFIGSSSEGLLTAKKLKKMLKGADVHLWNSDVFKASESTLTSLINESKRCDFAILLLTADDKTILRHKQSSSPRDNMVFELGLFMGEIGTDRTYLVTPQEKMHLPTDLDGITRKIIHENTAGRSLLKGVADQINCDIQTKGSR